MTINQPIYLAGGASSDKFIGIISPKNPGGYFPSGSAAADAAKAISNVIAIITLVAGLAFVYFFMVGAVNWITAGGDPQKSQAARVTILNALVGLAITVVAYPSILLLSRLLGLPLADPDELFRQLIF